MWVMETSVALPHSDHVSAASASQAFEKEPLAVQCSSGQHYKYEFLGSVVTTGQYLTENGAEITFVKVYEPRPQLGVYSWSW